LNSGYSYKIKLLSWKPVPEPRIYFFKYELFNIFVSVIPETYNHDLFFYPFRPVVMHEIFTAFFFLEENQSLKPVLTVISSKTRSAVLTTIPLQLRIRDPYSTVYMMIILLVVILNLQATGIQKTIFGPPCMQKMTITANITKANLYDILRTIPCQ
jgi:hypothetical protein